MKAKIVILFLLLSQISFAQTRYYFYGLGAGFNVLKGDIQSWNIFPGLQMFKTTRPSVSGELGIHVNSTFDLRLQGGFGLLNGNASIKPLPNLQVSDQGKSFTSLIADFNILADYNFFDFRPRNDLKFNYTPYFVGGLGYYFENGLGNSSFKANSPTIDYGIGLKWKLNKKLMIRFESLAKRTIGSNLDDIKYPISNTDQYFTNSISFIYSIPIYICPGLD